MLPSTSPQKLKKRRGRPSLYLTVYDKISKASEDGNNPLAMTDPIEPPKEKRRRVGKSSKADPDETAFRKFYEAGGRDYNQFLRWKSQLEQQEQLLKRSPLTIDTGGNSNSLRLPSSSSYPSPPLPCSTDLMLQRSIWTAHYLSALYPSLLQSSLLRPHQQQTPETIPTTKEPVSPVKRCSSSSSSSTSSISPQSPTTMLPDRKPATIDNDIATWGPAQVAQFVKSVPGCAEYSQIFCDQAISGAILSHLSEGHLVNFFGMKLGPAIYLKLKLNELLRSLGSKD